MIHILSKSGFLRLNNYKPGSGTGWNLHASSHHRSQPEYIECAGKGDPGMGPLQATGQVDKNTLENVYNKTWCDPNVSSTSLLQSLGWKSLETRRYNQRMMLMYKITHNLIAVPPTSPSPITHNSWLQPEILDMAGN